jgi:hypothetical protein
MDGERHGHQKKATTHLPSAVANSAMPKPARRRKVASGDVAPALTPQGIEGFTVSAAVDGAQESKMGAMRDVIAGMPVEESVALLKDCSNSKALPPAICRSIRMMNWPRTGAMVVIPI